MNVKTTVFLAIALAIAACGGEAVDKKDGAALSDAGKDSGRGDAGLDAGPADAAGDVATPDSAPKNDSAPTSCTGTCTTQTVKVVFGSVTEPIEHSAYGVDKDAQGKSGIYIEAWHGGFTGCPTQQSPTTERTLIISGLPLPSPGKIFTKAQGLVVSLFDFKGTLLKGQPLSKATDAKVTFVAASVCPSCVGNPAPADPKGFVALDITATFAEGTISGHVYATHCDTFDR